MKKSLLSRLTLLTTLLVIISACSKQTEYVNIIPADASVVVSVHLKSIAEKAGTNDKENKEAKQKLVDALKDGMNAAAFQQMETILKDPSKSGIDVTAPLYLFTSPGFPYGSVAAKVISEDDLLATLGALEKEQLSAPLTKGDGYQFTLINKQVLLAFTPSIAVFVSYNTPEQLEKIKQDITTLLKQTEENSIASNAGFKKMQKMGGDITLFASPAGLLGEYANQLNYGLPNKIDMKDFKVLGSLSFEKGKIILTMENYTENAEMKALMEKQLKATLPIENTFLNLFPQSTLALFSMGINGEECYNYLQENEEFRKNFSLTKAAEVKNLFGMFQKDLTVGLINVTMENAPTFLVYADVKSGAPLKQLYDKRMELGLKSGEEILKLGEEDYVYKSKAFNVFFGVRNKTLYATNDELLYKSIGKDITPSAKDTEYASYLKEKNVALVVNAEAILGLPIVKMFAEYGGAEYATYYALANKVAYLSTSAEGQKMEMTLQLKDKDVNALKQIVNFVKEFAGI